MTLKPQKIANSFFKLSQGMYFFQGHLSSRPIVHVRSSTTFLQDVYIILKGFLATILRSAQDLIVLV